MRTNQFAVPQKNMASYSVGDMDERPWGCYLVTKVGTNKTGEDYCEKKITVNPGHILSLQSHDHRRETWTVEEGMLTVILDGRQIELPPGQSLSIPVRGVHCMANRGDIPCIVRERQEGICREEDIRRYIDAYGRGTEASPAAAESITLYESILADLHKRAA